MINKAKLSPSFYRFPSLLGAGLLAGIGASTLQACDSDGGGPLGNLAEQCGLVCPAEGFVEGNAHISGIASIDAFFGAAIDLNAKMTDLSGRVRAELDAIAVSVGVEPGSSGAEIKAGLTAYLEGKVEGGLQIDFQPPKCEASVEASVSAAAECDVMVDPGEVSVKCEGSCKAEAGVEVDCGADASLKCEGTAPNLECAGTCSGSCAVELTAAASCEGTCKGTCSANGSSMDGFEGKCAGMCEGECVVEMKAGAMCEGRCEGSCEWTPPSGSCEANVEAKCEANAGASVECEAGCEGSAKPPEVSAECEASVEAKASASVECTPPSLDVGFQFAAGIEGGAMGEAEFRAWLEGFKTHFAALAALRVQAEGIVSAAGNLAGSATGAVKGVVDDLAADLDLKASIGAGCALGQLGPAATAIADASGSLTGEVQASVEVLTAFN